MERVLQKIKRNFILGDEWVYFKIYSGYKTADLVLTDAINPLVKELLEEKIIDKWFFIRYSDPDFHLRIRFRLTDLSQLGKLIFMMNSVVKPFLENMQVLKFQTDTYSRELERYGTNTVTYSEILFFYDSEMTTGMLDIIEGDEGEVVRWHFAIKIVDSFLNDFNFSENEKLELLDRLQNGFGSEFNMNKNLKIQIDRKFRNERKTIIGILNGNETINSDYAPLNNLIKRRSKKNKGIIEKINTIKSKNQLEIDLNDLISSYIHMMLNRIFKSNPRLNEMLIYSFLYRFYKSEIARKKSMK